MNEYFLASVSYKPLKKLETQVYEAVFREFFAADPGQALLV